jgi:uncharacterized protein with PIN domain
MTLICPQCQGQEIYPSNPKNVYEQVLQAFHLHAYRCHSCAKRFRAYTSTENQRILRDQMLVRIAKREFAARATM